MKGLKKILSLLAAIGMVVVVSFSEGIVVNAADPMETVLNNAVLTPTATGYEPADQAVEMVLSGITTPEMTTYQKVKMCYDHLINNCSYGFNEPIYEKINDYFGGYPGEVEAYGMLVGNVGVCDDYSAAFVALMRRLGLNSYVAVGMTHTTSGEYTPHAWAVVKIDGVEYVFDPQIDDNIAKGGPTGYYRFGKTYAQVPDKYIYEAISDKFLPFDYTEEQVIRPSVFTFS